MASLREQGCKPIHFYSVCQPFLLKPTIWPWLPTNSYFFQNSLFLLKWYYRWWWYFDWNIWTETDPEARGSDIPGEHLHCHHHHHLPLHQVDWKCANCADCADCAVNWFQLMTAAIFTYLFNNDHATSASSRLIPSIWEIVETIKHSGRRSEVRIII